MFYVSTRVVRLRIPENSKNWKKNQNLEKILKISKFWFFLENIQKFENVKNFVDEILKIRNINFYLKFS